MEPPTLKIENAILISWNLPPWGLADTVIEVANQAGGPWEPIEAAVQSQLRTVSSAPPFRRAVPNATIGFAANRASDADPASTPAPPSAQFKLD